MNKREDVFIKTESDSRCNGIFYITFQRMILARIGSDWEMGGGQK